MTLKAATQSRRVALTRDRRKLSRGALRSVTLAFGLLLAQSTQAERTFTTASLQGTYSYVNNNDDVASFGLIIFDGLGKLTVTIKANGPGTPETRKITTLTGTGTYNVDAAGTGTATIKFKGADVEREGTFDFVITETAPKAAAVPALAREVFAVQQVGGLHGQLVTPLWKRRAD